jgi:hypothetical protein
MDTTGCPAGLATDRAFYAEGNPFCGTQLSVFYGVTITVCVGRTIACLAKLQHYLKRAGCTVRNKKIVTMMVSIWSTLFYFLGSILIGLNVANAENGWSFSIYSICYLSFIIDFTMMLFKVVRLGKGIIALPRRELLGEVDYLQKFTLVGRSLVVFQIVMALTSSTCLIILSPALPHAEYVLGTIGFATKGAFQISCTIGLFLVSHTAWM